jgi:hypothetical protein
MSRPPEVVARTVTDAAISWSVLTDAGRNLCNPSHPRDLPQMPRQLSWSWEPDALTRLLVLNRRNILPWIHRSARQSSIRCNWAGGTFDLGAAWCERSQPSMWAMYCDWRLTRLAISSTAAWLHSSGTQGGGILLYRIQHSKRRCGHNLSHHG